MGVIESRKDDCELSFYCDFFIVISSLANPLIWCEILRLNPGWFGVEPQFNPEQPKVWVCSGLRGVALFEKMNILSTIETVLHYVTINIINFEQTPSKLEQP